MTIELIAVISLCLLGISLLILIIFLIPILLEIKILLHLIENIIQDFYKNIYPNVVNISNLVDKASQTSQTISDKLKSVLHVCSTAIKEYKK